MIFRVWKRGLKRHSETGAWGWGLAVLLGFLNNPSPIPTSLSMTISSLPHFSQLSCVPSPHGHLRTKRRALRTAIRWQSIPGLPAGLLSLPFLLPSCCDTPSLAPVVSCPLSRVLTAPSLLDQDALSPPWRKKTSLNSLSFYSPAQSGLSEKAPTHPSALLHLALFPNPLWVDF